jgi:hypothetical protein
LEVLTDLSAHFPAVISLQESSPVSGGVEDAMDGSKFQSTEAQVGSFGFGECEFYTGV